MTLTAITTNSFLGRTKTVDMALALKENVKVWGLDEEMEVRTKTSKDNAL